MERSDFNIPENPDYPNSAFMSPPRKNLLGKGLLRLEQEALALND